jgi:hypothetical protein
MYTIYLICLFSLIFFFLNVFLHDLCQFFSVFYTMLLPSNELRTLFLTLFTFNRIGHLANSPSSFLGLKKNVLCAKKQYTLWKRYVISSSLGRKWFFFFFSWCLTQQKMIAELKTTRKYFLTSVKLFSFYKIVNHF